MLVEVVEVEVEVEPWCWNLPLRQRVSGVRGTEYWTTRMQ